MKPTLYLFVGYPGAGKTTIAKLIETRTGAVHLWADHIRQQMFADPTHSREESKLLYDKLNDETAAWLQQGKSVIFDTNFNFYDDRELLRRIAADNGAETKLIWVTTPRDVAHQRAVHESNDQVTRIFGNMPETDFQRIAGNLQPPRPDEQAIEIDGTNLNVDDAYRLLGL